MTRWVVENLGPDVPIHFTALHPDWKMMDHPPTPPETLVRAREIALRNGVHYAYTGNLHDKAGQSTWRPKCKGLVIERDGYQLGEWHLDASGHCAHCGERIAGVFESGPGDWGRAARWYG